MLCYCLHIRIVLMKVMCVRRHLCHLCAGRVGGWVPLLSYYIVVELDGRGTVLTATAAFDLAGALEPAASLRRLLGLYRAGLRQPWKLGFQLARLRVVL